MTPSGMYRHNSVERSRSIIRYLPKGPRHCCLPGVRIRARLGCLCWRRLMLRLMVIAVRLKEAGLVSFHSSLVPGMIIVVGG